MTLRKLSRKCGISIGTLSRFARGGNLDVSSVLKLARFVDWTLAQELELMLDYWRFRLKRKNVRRNEHATNRSRT